MSLRCERCNEDVYHKCNGGDVEAEEEKKKTASSGGLSWLCLGSCGTKVKDVDVADNNEVEQVNATYKRRPTVQFQIAPDVVDGAPKKSNFKDQSSILKRLKSVQEEKHGFIIPPSRNPLKLMLVFPTVDATAEALKRAAEKLAFEITCSSTYDKALEEFQIIHHDLIIIDCRSSKSLDYDTLCRSIRNTKGCQHIVIVAITKKSAFEKDDIFITSILESGFNRCLVESTNTIAWINELTQLKNSDCRSTAQIGTMQILYAAINICKDPVIVTDDIARMQFLNGACERMLGFRQDETLGRTINEQLAHDILQTNGMINQLSRGKNWQGTITFKRKSLDPINTTCKALPIVCAGRIPTHFLMVIETPTDAPFSQARGSIHSLRKGSLDVKSITSDYYRRTSLAKLPLEAPITKIIGLIYEAQGLQTNNAQAALVLEKAVEMLKCTELYSPTVKEESRHEEPVASDLIGALLSNSNIPPHTINSRRSSNDSSIFRVSKAGIRMKNSPSGHIDKLLDSSLQWDFNIFKLELVTDKRPLLYLGYNLFTHFDVATTLNCEVGTLYNWLLKVEANYHIQNSYHNSTHAADVMQAIGGFLETERMKLFMDPMDQTTALIAAAAHDIDHPGKSSAFLANSNNPLAILYNDITILESHHAALIFKITLGDERCNIFKNLDKESYKIARYNVIDMILATEMTKHFEHLAKFVNVFCPKISSDFEDINNLEMQATQPENNTLVKRIMIKCADVSNPTRPLSICIEWARRIAEEYFQQTDDEKLKGLPVVMPMFDRATCSIPKSQVGFIDFIINDMIDAWHTFIDMPELVANMRLNYAKWKEFDEQGCTTLSDVKKLQETNPICKLIL